MSNKSDNIRSTNWCTLVYPESVDPNWVINLRNEHVPFAFSPLHLYDLEDDYLTLKKPHYHLIIKFDSLKSLTQVKDILIRVMGKDGAVQPFVCNSVRSYTRYFCHLDDPEKHQYNIEEIETYGLPLKDFLSFTPSEAKQIYIQIIQFLVDKNITEYSVLIKHCLLYNTEWLDVLSDHTCFVLNINSYLSSCRGLNKNKDEGN